MKLVLAAWVLAGSSQEPSAREIIGRIIEARRANYEAERTYVFHEQNLVVKLRADGSTSKTESQTHIVTPGPGGEYRRLVARNGQPLPTNKVREEDEKYEQYVQEKKRLSEEERRLETENKIKSRVERYCKRLEQALEVFDFEPLPDGTVDGQRVQVFRFTPKPGYKGSSLETKIFAKMEGTAWVDVERAQLARIEVRVREDFKLLAGVFGRISEGSAAEARALFAPEDELWLPDRVELFLNARLYFLKRYRQNITIDFSEYEKLPAQ